MLSDTYQRSWVPNDTNVLEEKNFARAVPRRLPAEVIYDALKMATAADERREVLASDMQQRAIGPSSAYQNRGQAGYALTAFGKPARIENCDCERSVEPSLLQVLYVRNDAEALAMIDQRGSWVEQIAREKNLRMAPSAGPMQLSDSQRQRLAQAYKQVQRLNEQIEKAQGDGKQKQVEALSRQRQNLRQRIAQVRGDAQPNGGDSEDAASLIDSEGPALVRAAYLRTLSRNPSEREVTTSLAYLRESETVAEGLRDLVWALVNTKEFMINH